MSGTTVPGETVVRRSGRGWVVGDEEASDLTSAMVLADLLAADLASAGSASSGSVTAGSASAGTGTAGTGTAGTGTAPAHRAAPKHARPMNDAAGTDEADEAARLAVTVAQLEHALTARVRVEQAIGVLAERHCGRRREQHRELTAAAARGTGAQAGATGPDPGRAPGPPGRLTCPGRRLFRPAGQEHAGYWEAGPIP